ncbi:hypothetical protein L6164_021718 [Bauhinia variegata]|uniref:Uncharacterized protein n=1 Tax=Bauhinia variegata TaxID=167791 RepID=A0ACB9MZ36_BAUVA|nr:hypothetical protein L6164_021718 [Bauhinia variegata]
MEGSKILTKASRSLSFWEGLRSTYSATCKIKRLVRHARFFPPNIDFRRGDKAEALAKSLGNSKATVEDSARSAAKIAGETVKRS